MLWTLRASLPSDMKACFHKFTAEIQDLGDRVNHLEDGMSACVAYFNTMVDAHNKYSDKINWLKSKVADHEYP